MPPRRRWNGTLLRSTSSQEETGHEILPGRYHCRDGPDGRRGAGFGRLGQCLPAHAFRPPPPHDKRLLSSGGGLVVADLSGALPPSLPRPLPAAVHDKLCATLLLPAGDDLYHRDTL